MPWSKFDDAFWSHPKTLRAGNEAVGAFVRLVCYCSQHLTDGAIDGDTALSIALRPKVLEKLVAVGLLEQDGGSFRVRGYLEHHPSRAQVEAQREAKTHRQNRWRSSASRVQEPASNAGKVTHVDASTAPSRDASTSPSRDGVRDDAPSHPIPSHPIPREELTSFVLAREAHPPKAEPVKSKPSKTKPAQLVVDVPPAEGTTARRVYDAIITDPVLSSLVRPGDFASRVCADGAYPGVDVLAEVRRAGAWAAGKGRSPWRDVRAALTVWLRRASQEAQQSPQAHRVAPPVVQPVSTPANGFLAGANSTPLSKIREAREKLARIAAGIDEQAPEVTSGQR